MPAGVWWMAAGLGAIAAAAAIRSAAAGTLKVDDVTIGRVPASLVIILVVSGVMTLCGGHIATLRRLAMTDRAVSWSRLIGWALAMQAIAALALPLTSNDIFSNLHYGQLEAFLGIRAATASPDVLLSGSLAPWVGHRWTDVPCVYGPVLIFCFRLLSLASGGTLVGGVVLHKLLMLLLSLIWVWLCASHTRRTQDGGLGRRRFWLLACHPLWLFDMAGQAHNDALVVVLLMAAAVLHVRGRAFSATILLGLATASKYFPVVAFGYLLWWLLLRDQASPGRRIVGAAGHVALYSATVVLCYAPTWEGWRTIAYPGTFAAEDRLERSPLRLAAWLASPWGPDASRHASWWAAALCWASLAGLALWWMARFRRPEQDADTPWQATISILTVYLVFLNGLFQVWYLVWILPFLVGTTQRGWWALALVCGYVSVLYYGVKYAGLPDAATILVRLVVAIMLVRMARALPPLPASLDPPGLTFGGASSRA